MKTSKLSIKLLWYITPLVILPLLFLGGFTLTNVTSSTQKQAKLTVSRFVEQQHQKMFNYIEIYQSTTKLLSTSPVLSDFLAKDFNTPFEQTARLGALMDVFASYSDAYPDILSINLVSPEGESKAYYANNLNQAPQSYPFFEQVKNSSMRQQKFMVPTENNTTHIYLVQQIFSVDYQLKRPKQQGYIIVQVDPSVIHSSILESPYNNTLNLLITQQGEILFSSDPSLYAQSLNADETQQIQETAERSTLKSIKLASVDSIERMVYAVQLSGGYYYLSSIPKALLYQSGKAISLITALIVILSVITLPILIFIVVRNLLLNPIELLGAASHKVGDGNLSVSLPEQSNDEVGLLFRDFNHMVKQIRDSQSELKTYKLHLEEMVDVRTNELEQTNQQLEIAIKEAEQASDLKSRFLANMSHEIRTPLTAIMGFTEQLIINPQATANRNHLSTVLRNSKHLLELINNILDLSKIEAEKLDVENRPFKLQPLLEDVESIIAPLAQEKQLSFSMDYQFPLPRSIYSDITRLKQILLNITSNAVKFTEYGGIRLSVRFIHQSQSVEFIVEDTGIGMSSGEIKRVFKPFEQADSTTTRRFGGTGLGLCISKNLAQLLGGDVEVLSEQGVGSKFTIRVKANFPNGDYQLINKLEESVQLPDASQELAATQFDANILLAEDNPDNQELICLLLDAWGIKPDIANNGAEAVEKALVNDYQLILMDMQMPVMGGLEATEMLRHAAYDGPIIALTANVMKHDVESYLAAGCDATLAKPIDKKQLGQVLLEHLQIQAASQSKWDSLLASEKFVQINKNYMEKLPDYLKQVQTYYDNQEWESLRALAHSLKGSAGCFGFMNIHSAAEELENSLMTNQQSQWQYAQLNLCEAIKYTLTQQSEH
jgi:signal transduction histidine kinase/CheY-like chemotaxis protein